MNGFLYMSIGSTGARKNEYIELCFRTSQKETFKQFCDVILQDEREFFGRLGSNPVTNEHYASLWVDGSVYYTEMMEEWAEENDIQIQIKEG